MDQKALITALKKYHFWAILIVALASVLGVYFVISGPSLAKQTQQKETQLRDTFVKISEVSRVENHPNETVKGGIEKETKKLTTNVQKAWESLYGEQRANNQLPGTLKKVKGFNEAFEQMMGSGTPLDTLYCETYQDFIIPHVKDKFDALKLREVEKSDDAGADDSKQEGLVEWENDWGDANRKEILDRFRWRRTPSSGAVLLAQEDLWVYEALLRIILNTNEKTATGSEAVTYENVAVRKIDTLQIADNVSGMVTTGGGGADEAKAGGAMESTDAEKRRAGGPAIDYPKGRYVDDRGGPLGPADPHPFAEYKIMPIRLKLDLDQRMIAKLLAECDSSNMPVEVKRIRLNPGAGLKFDLKLPTEEGGGGDDGGKPEDKVRVDMYIPIELLGVIYIYNPPDEKKLGTGTVAEGAAGKIEEEEGIEEEEEEEEKETPPEETPEAADETARTGPGQPSPVGGP